MCVCVCECVCASGRVSKLWHKALLTSGREEGRESLSVFWLGLGAVFLVFCLVCSYTQLPAKAICKAQQEWQQQQQQQQQQQCERHIRCVYQTALKCCYVHCPSLYCALTMFTGANFKVNCFSIVWKSACNTPQHITKGASISTLIGARAKLVQPKETTDRQRERVSE